MEENGQANHVKSYLGKNVNIHLKDGSVIINVRLTRLRKDYFKNMKLVDYVFGIQQASISLRSIARIDRLNRNLLVKI